MSVHNKLYVRGELFTHRVDGTDFTTADWAHLGTVDQDLSKTDEVEFQAVTFNNGANTTKIQSGAVSDYTLTLPDNVGSSGNVLQTDGSGNLSWGSSNSFDQSLDSSDSPSFQGLTINNGTNTTSIQTGATSDYSLTLPAGDGNTGDVLQTDGSGVLSWVSSGGNPFDQSLNKTDNVLFSDLTLTGDLNVQGTTTIINTTNTEIKDNVILFNSGEVGAGVTNNTAGLEIDRGTLDNVALLFDESIDKWTVGASSGSIGTDRYLLTENADETQTPGVIPGYDSNGRLAESAGLDSGEVAQLKNIDSVTIDNTQWAHLGALDQGITTTSDVTFNNVNIDGTLTVSSLPAGSISSVLTADPSPMTDFISVFDTSGGAISPTLPDNASNAGKTFIVHLLVAGNDLTVTCAGTDTIDEDNTILLDVALQYVRLTSVGNGTWVVS